MDEIANKNKFDKKYRKLLNNFVKKGKICH